MNTIVVVTRGGCLVDVKGLPEGWTWDVLDWDDIGDVTDVMSYKDDFRRELRALIEGGDVDMAVEFATEKILESYRNGQQKARRGGGRPVRSA